jgi:hypothetical protein
MKPVCSASITVFRFLRSEIRSRRACCRCAAPIVGRLTEAAPRDGSRTSDVARRARTSRFWAAPFCHCRARNLSDRTITQCRPPHSARSSAPLQPRPRSSRRRAREVEKLRPRMLEDARAILVRMYYGSRDNASPDTCGRGRACVFEHESAAFLLHVHASRRLAMGLSKGLARPAKGSS